MVRMVTLRYYSNVNNVNSSTSNDSNGIALDDDNISINNKLVIATVVAIRTKTW